MRRVAELSIASCLSFCIGCVVGVIVLAVALEPWRGRR